MRFSPLIKRVKLSLVLFYFEDCVSLTSVYFTGNAPTDCSMFDGDFNATPYYLPGSTAWSSGYAGNFARPALL